MTVDPDHRYTVKLAHVVELDGLPAPDVSSCLPPLVVKSVSEASCVRFLSSSAIEIIISLSLVI